MSIISNEVINDIATLTAPIQTLCMFRVDNIQQLESASSRLFNEMLKIDKVFNNTDNVKVKSELKAYKAELYKKQNIYKTGAKQQLELLLELIEAYK